MKPWQDNWLLSKGARGCQVLTCKHCGNTRYAPVDNTLSLARANPTCVCSGNPPRTAKGRTQCIRMRTTCRYCKLNGIPGCGEASWASLTPSGPHCDGTGEDVGCWTKSDTVRPVR